ncbi:meckelin [Amblyraja radiata]|uniref:meckelin n=1 Tax=Amblyraja radiata TaxID=386614 RepID=UPI001403A5A4|nr:meckelin [Amblyraja radiata]
MATRVLCLLLALIRSPSPSQSFSLPFESAENCTKKQWFDISQMICVPCGPHQHASDDATITAADARLYTNNANIFFVDADEPGSPFHPAEPVNLQQELLKAEVFLGGRWLFEELSDLSGRVLVDGPHQAVTQDGWNCIMCPIGAIIDNNGRCQCPSGQILGLLGSLDGSTGGLCFLNRPKDLTSSVTTDIVYGQGLKVSSAWFATHLKASAIACLRFANLTACQAVGNMCVMIMNSIDMVTTPNDACTLYDTIFKKTVSLGNTHSIPSWRINLPWLYFDTQYGFGNRLIDQEPFQTIYHFKSSKHMELQFILAKYDAQGFFLKWEKATGGTLQLCPDTLPRLNIAYIFGVTYQQSCTLSVSKLLSKYDKNHFYDIYILYKGEDGEDKLRAVAIRNLNLQYNGKFVNRDKMMNTWYLTRRIFLVDTLSGREMNLDSQPKAIRVASHIKISVILVPNTLQGKVIPPMMTISYTDIQIQNPEQQTVSVSFSVEYQMDLITAFQNTKIALGFLSGLSAIYSMIKTATWKKRVGSPMIDIPTVLKFLLFYAGDLANTFFIVTFGTGIYWLIFFKGQRVLSVLLPTPNQEIHFISSVASAFTLKFIQLLHKLGNQLTVDIFFIDWERPKGKIVKSIAGGGDIKTAPAPVSIWRTYFVANEWNNIQTIRKINPIFQLLTVIFFLEIAGFANLATMDPYSKLTSSAESSAIPPSRILRFGVATTIWLLVGFMQIIFCASIYERFVEDRISQFIDVCSVSNISVIIFSHKCFGYYIHGRSVHGHSDTNMEEMNLNLKREAENLCGQRGLVPNTEIETFQIFITSKLREQYDKIREPLNWIRSPGHLVNNAEDAVEQRMKAYNTTNRFLGSFIDHALRDMDYIVQDKLLLERIMGMELHEPIDKTIFYNDEKLSFTDILYYGNEETLLIFDMLFFCIVDLATQNFFFASFLTYVQQKIFQFIRNAAGRKNLAAKTLIDERFLL